MDSQRAVNLGLPQECHSEAQLAEHPHPPKPVATDERNFARVQATRFPRTVLLNLRNAERRGLLRSLALDDRFARLTKKALPCAVAAGLPMAGPSYVAVTPLVGEKVGVQL